MLGLVLALFVLVPPQPAQPASASANVWEGRTAEFEQFLREVRVERVTELEIGVTRPRRAFVAPGGLADSFAWKPLKPGRYNGYWESYKSEIAAYELDKLLGLNMVPPTVARRVNGDDGAAVLWLQNVRSWESVLPLPKPATWNFQIARMKMFDDLIGNSDRNKGNLLVDGRWTLYLIDHSRAFATDNKLPQVLENIDKRLWEAMAALDEPTLKTGLGKWIDRAQIGALLRRRDRMKQAIDALVAKHGDKIFF
jgi:hypothetical protein